MDAKTLAQAQDGTISPEQAGRLSLWEVLALILTGAR
jgi:hypothetical protein